MEELPFNIALLLPILIISVALTVIALVDCLRSEHTNGPKGLWIAIILVINMIGPILYFVIGRSNR